MTLAAGRRPSARESAGNYLSSVAGNYLFLGLSLLTSLYLTRSLGAERFGRLTLVFAVAHTALLFTEFWTRAAFLRYATEELARSGRLRRVFWARMLILAPLAAVVALLGWAFRADIAAFHGAGDVGFTLLAMYFAGLFVGQTLQVVFQARSRSGIFAFFQAAERALTLLTLLVMGARGYFGLAAILMIYTAASLATSLLAATRLGRDDLLPMETSRSAARRLLAFSTPMAFGVVGSYLTSNWFDVAMIRHFLGLTAVGHYSLAYQLMGAVQQIPMLSFPVVVPLLVGAHVAERRPSIQLYLDRVIPHGVFAMMALLGAGALVGPTVVRVIFGEAFSESADLFPVLLLAVGWYCIFIGYLPILNLHERTGSLLAASLGAAAFNVVGDLALIPLWGTMGAAWATVSSQLVSALIVVAVARQEYQFTFAPVAFMLVPLTVVVLGTVVGPPGTLAAAALVAVALLAVAARALRLGSVPDRRLLASLDLPGLKWVLR